MKGFRILLGRALIGLAAVVALGSAAAPAPAQAAPITLVVDDPSDGIQCPGAVITNFLGFYLESHPLQSNETITLCAGEYAGIIPIHGLSNVTVIGKADPQLGPPRLLPANTNRNTRELWTIIDIADSTNITITGLTLDAVSKYGFVAIKGQSAWGNAPNFPVSAIHVSNSTVSISDNTIINMKLTVPGQDEGTGVRVEGPTSAPKAITIQNNRFLDFHEFGILVDNTSAQYRPSVTGNLFFSAFNLATFSAVRFVRPTAGTISDNEFRSNWDPLNGVQCVICSAGVELDSPQNVRVINNTFRGLGMGISTGSVIASIPMTGNQFTGNLIDGSPIGILFEEVGETSSPLLIARNTVTGNTITLYMMTSLNMFGIVLREGTGPGTITYSGNTISGNTIQGYGDQALSLPALATKQMRVRGNKTGDFMP